MSQNGSSNKPELPTIKIAGTTSGSVSRPPSANVAGPPPMPEVGPGDPAAAPSVAPELVDVPDPPTASELVVKSSAAPPSVSAARSHGASGNANNPSASTAFGASEANQADPSSQGISGPSGTLGTPQASGYAPSVSGSPASGAPSTAGSPATSVSRNTGSPGSMGSGASSGTGGGRSPSPSQYESKSSPAHSKHHHHKKSPGDKVTKFRYHRRVTVHTTGKVNPNGILDKVKTDINPEELLKKTGMKTDAHTHWRMRLRQTKRLTKGGKTTAQTKVTYRDSEGHVKKEGGSADQSIARSERTCNRCDKKLEDCQCDNSSSQR